MLQEGKMSKRNRTLNSFFEVRTTGTAETGPSIQTTDNTPHIKLNSSPVILKKTMVREYQLRIWMQTLEILLEGSTLVWVHANQLMNG